MSNHQNNLTNKKSVARAAEILSSLEPGFLPKPIFEQFTRLCVTPIIELVPFRLNSKGDIEILLKKRPKNDPDWPDMLHTPGTVLRATNIDDGIENALKRIATDELKIHKIPTPSLTGPPLFHRVNRGVELASIYYVDLSNVKVEGDWHEVNNLPDRIVSTQIEFINIALEKFKKEVNNE